ncbi:MAG: hypothetical protein FWF88_12615, partial [Peptococcaceae bacterium]|nr:hypothetical protein [Peptococcaceae bacterium]
RNIAADQDVELAEGFISDGDDGKGVFVEFVHGGCPFWLCRRLENGIITNNPFCDSVFVE